MTTKWEAKIHSICMSCLFSKFCKFREWQEAAALAYMQTVAKKYPPEGLEQFPVVPTYVCEYYEKEL